MSKPTVSAAGGAMPAEGHKTRRALLRLSEPRRRSPSCPPARPRSRLYGLPVHPDAALFAMQSAIDAADKEFNAALDALARPTTPIRQGAGRAGQAERTLPEELQALDCLALPPRCGRSRAPSPARWPMTGGAAHEREVERLKAECGVTAAHEWRPPPARR